MKEVLNNQQIVCPGDATQFMHAIFSSDHEMMTFYRQRLEDLENVLFGNVAAFEAVHHFKKISVKDVIKGFGMHMMNMQVSNTNRMQSANIMGSFIDCIIDTTKNSWQYKQMYRVNHLHLENVRYLLNRLNEE